MTDRVPNRKREQASERISNERRVQPFVQHLGVLRDRQVARMAGVPTSAVRRVREGLKIARSPSERQRRLPGSKLDAFHEIVGVLPDREVARRAGVSPPAVSSYRRTRGIAPAVPSLNDLLGRARALSGLALNETRPATLGSLWCWRLIVRTPKGDATRFAVAQDARAACAAAAMLGEVLEVERLGVALHV